jgi:hypothetical protein
MTAASIDQHEIGRRRQSMMAGHFGRGDGSAAERHGASNPEQKKP